MFPGAMFVLGEEVTDKALPAPLRLHQILTDEIFQGHHVHCNYNGIPWNKGVLYNSLQCSFCY
jgi:hypothetical protein